jgi:hypothetical protein
MAVVILDMWDGLEECIYGCNPFLGESFCNYWLYLVDLTAVAM